MIFQSGLTVWAAFGLRTECFTAASPASVHVALAWLEAHRWLNAQWHAVHGVHRGCE